MSGAIQLGASVLGSVPLKDWSVGKNLDSITAIIIMLLLLLLLLLSLSHQQQGTTPLGHRASQVYRKPDPSPLALTSQAR